MHILLVWNDTAANRIVKFSVEYSIEANTLHVFDLKPLEVSLLDLQSNTVVTRMNVRSNKTYDLLRTRFLDSDGLNTLVNEIAKHHDLSVVAR